MRVFVAGGTGVIGRRHERYPSWRQGFKEEFA